MSLMNAAVRMYLKRFDREVHLMRTDPMVLQQEVLRKLISSSLVQYFHPDIKSIDDFSNQKTSQYTDYETLINQLKSNKSPRCRYYAQSSGTSTGKVKHIPTPNDYVKANHLRGSWYNLHTLHGYNDDINVFKSKNLLIGGSIYERHRDYQVGDVSGIMISRIPSFFQPYYVPSIQEATIPQWEEKLELTAQAAVRTKRISLTGGVPTWVLTLFRRIIEIAEVDRISDLWPELRAYLHGGVSLEPYRQEFAELIDIEDFRFLEIYNATEGFLAYQDEPHADGMLLMTGAGIYFEFVERQNYKKDIDPKDIITIADASADTDYVLLITTGSGFVRYVMGDVVRFTSTLPPRIKVVGRLSDYINAFGEDLSLEHAESALLDTLAQHDASVMHYTVAPRYITISENGCHEWFIEFEKEPRDFAQFAKDLDHAVQQVNSNYAQKRTGSIALDRLRVHSMPEGTFAQYMQSRGRITGQSKVRKLSNDRQIAEELIHMNEKY